jgi:hypothetical protein
VATAIFVSVILFTSSFKLNSKNLTKMGREVAKVYNGIEKREGEGVMITRSIGNSYP